MQTEEYDTEKRLSYRQKIIRVSEEILEERLERELIREHVLEVSAERKSMFQITCTPEYITELILGRLLSERMIDSAADVAKLTIDCEGRHAQVKLKKNKKDKKKNTRKIMPIEWKQEWIFALAELFEHNLPLYQKTKAAHCSYLMTAGKVIFSCEDIGRHNVVDKAIGYALRNQINLDHSVLYISGRMPTDMVSKVICAGIPVLVSKTMPTREAVEMAQEYGLTLIGGARRNQFDIYTKTEIEEEAERYICKFFPRRV